MFTYMVMYVNCVWDVPVDVMLDVDRHIMFSKLFS